VNNLPPDARADRQTIYAGLIAFVVGFVVVLVTFGWLIVHFVAPEAHWWDILHTSINAVLISVLGGLCFCAAIVGVLTKVHYLRGVYRCRFCGRPLKGVRIRCGCAESEALSSPIGVHPR
jgi:cytochrome c biogenesis protein CcdA